MMITHQQCPMIARPPPQAAPAHLKRDIAAGELGVQFLHVDIVAVSSRPGTKRMLVADEFGICAQGYRVGQLDPPSEVPLDLFPICIVLPHIVLPEPYGSLPNRNGVPFNLESPTKPDRVSLLITRYSLLITRYSLLITRN